MSKEWDELRNRPINNAQDAIDLMRDSREIRDRNIRKIDLQHKLVTIGLVIFVLIVIFWELIYYAIGQ